jgi:hypothetical protein
LRHCATWPDMGAIMLFDDAEGLADPKADPDKEALILAWNRKGGAIPIKEAGPDGRWHTRWLNAYCPRGLTALCLPFPALHSRSIVVPLIASADAEHANRDPENPDDWPVDQRALRDDLWALALFLHSEAATIWTELSKETSTLRRDWERWQAIIAMAPLLERHGVEGLEQDMRAVMITYQAETADLEGESRFILVIRGLMRVVHLKPLDVWTLADVSDISPERVHVTASQMVEAIKAIVAGKEDPDEFQGGHERGKTVKPWYDSARSVGRLLSKLRLQEDRDSSQIRERYRVTSAKDVFYLAPAHHIVHLKDKTSEPDVSRNPRNIYDMSADQSEPTDEMASQMNRSTPNGSPPLQNMHSAPTSLLGKTSEPDLIEPKNVNDGHVHLSAGMSVTTKISERSEVLEHAAATSIEQSDAELNRRRHVLWADCHERLRHVVMTAIDLLQAAVDTATLQPTELLKIVGLHEAVGAPKGDIHPHPIVQQ